MIRLMIWMAVIGIGPVVVRTQPSECFDDSQCSEGLYCESRFCRQCLLCEDLHREPPKVPTSCVKSIIECGACFKGNDAVAGCVPPGDNNVNTYDLAIWIVVGCCIAFFSIVAVVICRKFKNMLSCDIFSRDSSPRIPTTTVRVEASAPPLNKLNGTVNVAPAVHLPPPPPPPAQAHASPTPLQASSVPGHDSPPPYDTVSGNQMDAELKPLMNEIGPTRPSQGRERAGNQEANRFQRPWYERHPNTIEQPSPEAYENVVEEEERDEQDRVPPSYFDEETMMSTWTANPPNTSSNGQDVDAINLPGSSGGRESRVRLPPPEFGPPDVLQHRDNRSIVESHTNNRHSSGGGGEDGGAGGGDAGNSGAQAGNTVFNFNLFVNNSNEQHNNLCLQPTHYNAL